MTILGCESVNLAMNKKKNMPTWEGGFEPC